MTAQSKPFLQVALSTALLLTLTGTLFSASPNPGDLDYAGREGANIYVSKLGDNSDGSSWATAYNSIQAALLSIPDDQGGHQVIVRPDHYMEPNLAPNQKGAAGSYNQLVGDVDGTLGSGASGWVTIDAGDPTLGFKSWDWWTNIAASDANWPVGNNGENVSSIIWDRWALNNIYATGGDAALFWDLTHESGNGFTILVEDCVGIGRAFGGGVVYPSVRPDEPSIFRRSYFMGLDWVGDTAAVLVGGTETTMPDDPHVRFEDCVLVHPDNAVAASYASSCVRAEFDNCRLIALNFTQPGFSEMTGLIYTRGTAADKLHVDLNNCLLAGYKLFGSEDPADLTYSSEGEVLAYVQFQQAVPLDFTRLGAWPSEAFSLIAPPAPGATAAYTQSATELVAPIIMVVGDANTDGTVNDTDASILASNWLKTGNATWGEGDFNGDGNVDAADASLLAANWQFSLVMQEEIVPEPSTLILLLSSIVGLCVIRRNQSGRLRRINLSI